MRWKALPPSLDQHGRRFVSRLRHLKDHSGLTLKSLASKTHFSASSWDRYLNGRVLPPEAAVEALARIADVDAVPLLTLRDVAEKNWRAADGSFCTVEQRTEKSGGDPGTGRNDRNHSRRIHVGALSLTAGAILSSAMFSLALVLDTHFPTVEPGHGTSSGVGQYDCTYKRRGDLLFSGNSTTSSRLVMLNSTGPDTAEVQCLLSRHKLSPGDVDGYFGPRTEAQVKRLQRQDHVPVDGIVGEETWGLLRHVE